MLIQKKFILIAAVVVAGVALLLFSYMYSREHENEVTHTIQKNTACAYSDELLSLFDPQVLTNEGDLFFNGERGYDRVCARLAYERAITLSGSTTYYAQYQLGRINFIEGKFDTAIEQFILVRTHAELALPSVHYMLGLTYGYKAHTYGTNEDWIKAEESFKRFLLRRPKSPWAATDLAWVYFAQGKYKEMLPVLEQSLSYNPTHAWVNNMYGLALMNTGKPDEAIQYFEIAERESMSVTVEEWGAAYPGNNPQSYEKGLEEMRTAIQYNLKLARENSAQ